MSKAQGEAQRLTHKPMDQYDLIRHHYGRRVQWGTDTILYRKNHPMLWKGVSGNYQNWEIDISELIPGDAESAYGEPARLFYSDDMTVSLSRRKESMPYFYRNCDADELHLINRGKMVYETDFGNIEVRERNFLLIPKGVTYRVLLERPQETLRVIYESEPEIFVVPAEMVEHIYRKGRPALKPEGFKYPELPKGPPPGGKFDVRVKYKGAFSDFLGETTSIIYGCGIPGTVYFNSFSNPFAIHEALSGAKKVPVTFLLFSGNLLSELGH